MKPVLVILLMLGLATSVDAQTKVRGGTPIRTRVILAAPIVPAWSFGFGLGAGRFSPFYSSFYSPFNDPFNDPYYRRPVGQSLVPDELQVTLDEIENDYDYQIARTRDDEKLKGKERRQKLRELKYDREAALIKARKSFIHNSKADATTEASK